MTRCKGVTLVEVLVTAVLMALIGAAAAMLLRNLVTTDQRLSETSVLYGRARACFELMVTELRHAHAVEHGTADSVAFRAVIDDESHRYCYWAQDYQGSSWLFRSVDEAASERIMPIASVGISYYGEGGEALPTPITSADPVPRAVGLHMVLQAPNEQTVQFTDLISLRNRQ